MDGFLRVALNRIDHGGNFGRGLGRTFSQFAYFVGDDGKAPALFAGPRRFDGRVECKEVGLVGDFLNYSGDTADFLRALAQLFNRCGRGF